MSRKSKKQKILDLAEAIGLRKTDIDHLAALVDAAKKDEISLIKYAMGEIQEIAEIFDEDDLWKSSIWLPSYKRLLEAGFIRAWGRRLEVLVLDDEYLTALLYRVNNEGKRKYARQPLAEQETIEKLVARFEKYEDSREKESEGAKIDFNAVWKLVQGVKFPRSFKALFTGDKLSREEQFYLCGLNALSWDGDIYNFEKPYIIRMLQKLFEDKSMNEGTCYRVHESLVAKGILAEIGIRKEGRKEIIDILRITGLQEGFTRNDLPKEQRGYIAIPFMVFKKAFKGCSNAARKIIFDILFKYNNGENKGGKVDLDKPVEMTVFARKQSTQDQKKRYQTQVLDWLHKRCKAEVLDTVFGRKGSVSLGAFFHIDQKRLKKEGILYFRLREEYRIRKSAVRRLAEDIMVRFERRVNNIREGMEACTEEGFGFDCTNEDIQGFIKVLGEAGKATTRRLIRELGIEIRRRKEEGVDKIRSLPGYLDWMYKQFKIGDRVELALPEVP